DLSVQILAGGARAELQVQGTAPAQFTRWDVASQSDQQVQGRVKVNASAVVQSSLGALATMTVDINETGTYEYQVENDGTWQTVRREHARIQAHAEVNQDNSITIDGSFEFTTGELVGEGFLEHTTQGTFHGEGQLDEQGWESFFAVANTEGSNLMEAYLRITADGEATGWVKNAQGQIVASIQGNLTDGIEVCVQGLGCKRIW
ncbi:MAG: hypothetical protein J7M26_05825, partial [Armatimonadetes bacterium]|nr:hypothetical protein [Armatimonadota bacterium]